MKPKGMSDGPGEVPMTLADVTAIMRAHAPVALKGPAEIADDPKAPKTARTAAAKALRDHAQRRVPNGGGESNV
jgi:hypothetical protein